MRPANPDEEVVHWLPAPPPTSYASGGTRGRTKSAAYVQWLRMAAWALARSPTFELDSVEVHVDAFLARQRVLDDVLRPVVAALIKARVVYEDRYVDRLSVTRCARRSGTNWIRVTMRRLGSDLDI